MKYTAGQTVIDTDGDKGVIVSIISSQLLPYGVKVEGYDLPIWYTETGIRLDEDVLQAENERLRVALESALSEAKHAHALSTVQNYEEWIESIVTMLEKAVNHATA